MNTTAARSRSTSSPRGNNNGSRQVKAVSKRVASRGQALQAEIGERSRAVAQRTSELLHSAGEATRRHPWAAAGIVAAGAALIGGALWAHRRH
jgi:ElaB/YqjD/DUF883 family membrane-anchored ribosome-binding protein